MLVLPAPLDVFVSYAAEDEPLHRELEKHLATLQRRGRIAASFHAGVVSPGRDWKAAMDAHLDQADIVLLLPAALRDAHAPG